MENQSKALAAFISSLEPIAEDEYGRIMGGFANASGPSVVALDDNNNVLANCPVTNNCSGGNCVAGCGGNES